MAGYCPGFKKNIQWWQAYKCQNAVLNCSECLGSRLASLNSFKLPSLLSMQITKQAYDAWGFISLLVYREVLMDSTTNLLGSLLALFCTLHTLFLCPWIPSCRIHSSSRLTHMVAHLNSLHNPFFSLCHLTLSHSAATHLWTIIIIHLIESLFCLEFAEYTAPLLMLAESASVSTRKTYFNSHFPFFFSLLSHLRRLILAPLSCTTDMSAEKMSNTGCDAQGTLETVWKHRSFLFYLLSHSSQDPNERLRWMRR